MGIGHEGKRPVPAGRFCLVGGMENTETVTAESLAEARAAGARRRAEQGEADPFAGMFQDPGATPGLMDSTEPVRPDGDSAESNPYPTPADEPEFSEEPSGQVHLVVEGAHEKLGLNVTGRTPTSSTLAITGGKVEVAGQYDLGDTVSFRVTVVIGDVGFKDETDSKTRQVVGRERRHKGSIIGISEV